MTQTERLQHRYSGTRARWEVALERLGWPRDYWHRYVAELDLSGIEAIPTIAADDIFPSWDPFRVAIPVNAEFLRRSAVRHPRDPIGTVLDESVLFAEERVKAHYAALAAAIADRLTRELDPFRSAVLVESMLACAELFRGRDARASIASRVLSERARARDPQRRRARQDQDVALKRRARDIAKRHPRMSTNAIAARLVPDRANTATALRPGVFLPPLTQRTIRLVIQGIGTTKKAGKEAPCQPSGVRVSPHARRKRRDASAIPDLG